MKATVQDLALMDLRVRLYTAVQMLKGDALEELRILIGEIAMILRVDGSLTPPAAVDAGKEGE